MFNKPYPFSDSPRERLVTSILFSAFVFLFLRIFQPFEINKLQHSLTTVVLGYALVCFFSMVLLNIVIFQLFPKIFTEPKWTTGREIGWTIVNVSSIGLFNFLYSFAIGITDFRLLNLLLFMGFTIAVAAFPLTVVILLNQIRLNRKYIHESDAINQHLDHAPPLENTPSESTLRIAAENGEIILELDVHHFLYAQSDDNYIEIHFQSNGQKAKKLIRNTLKNLQLVFETHPSCFRCHKSYLVNLSHVYHLSGNSQGYKLHLHGVEERIPVSRSNNDFIKNFFSTRP